MLASTSGSLKVPSGLLPPPLNSLFESDQKRDDASFISSEDILELNTQKNKEIHVTLLF
jgi:hypothetical protein